MDVFHAAKFLQQGGAVVVGLAEYEGAIYRAKGLDVEALMRHRKGAVCLVHEWGLTRVHRGASDPLHRLPEGLRRAAQSVDNDLERPSAA